MIRRSVFADKLKEFPFVFGDDAICAQRGQWRKHFQERNDNSPPLAGGVGGGGKDDGVRLKEERASSSSFILTPSSILLEIGCYNAEFLARIAAKHPSANFVGLDWKARPLYLGAQKIAERALTNLALLHARAQQLGAIFADGELDEIWLLHPDPFDSDRERSMRLMSESFLAQVHRLLRPGGRFVLKTDHREYFDSALLDLHSPTLAGLFRTEQSSTDLWHDDATISATQALCLAGETTLFERRFIKRRTPICFLSLVRV